MSATVKDVRAAIANLPDDAALVLWIFDEHGDRTAVDVSEVAAYGPHGQSFHAAPDSLHLYEKPE